MSNEKNVFTRRDFIRNAVGAAAVAGLAGGAKAQIAKPGRKSRVVLVRDEAVMDDGKVIRSDILKKMLDDTVIAFTGHANARDAWLSLVTPNDRVGLVPTDHLNPTHKEVYDAVFAALVAAGVPKSNITDAQGGPEKPKSCTALIALPALKAHWLTGIGTVLKNYIMYSGDPEGFHRADSAKLGKIWNLDFVKGKTRLVLVDALEPLCDKGPQPDPQYRWPYKGLIAGKDPVAVECVCLKIIMARRRLVKGEPWPLSPPPLCVEAADKTFGLGTSRWEEIMLQKLGWAKDVLV